MSRSRFRGPSRPLVVAILAGLAINLAPAARPEPVQAAPPAGPVAEWTFDETSGTTAHDSASTHDGTLLGDPTWSPTGGHDGSGALLFDGDGDGVQVPTAAALEPTSLSIVMWMKGSRTSNGPWDMLLQKGANSCEAGSYGLLAYGQVPDQLAGYVQARADLSPADGIAWGWSSPDARLWDGAWHLVGWTFDDPSNTSRVYVDGIPSETTFGSVLYGLPTASDLYIGREPTDCPETRDLQGALDDVRLYDRALSPSEIAAMVPAVSTSATFSIETNPIQWSHWTWATVTVAPAPVESAEVRVYDVSNGGHVLKAVSGTAPATGVAQLQLISGDLAAFDVGSYDLVAEVSAIGPYEASTSNHQTLVIDKFVNVVSIDGPTSASPGSTVQLVGTVSNYTDGTATFYEDHGGGNIDSIGSAPLVWNNGNYLVTIETPALDLGDHTFFMRISETAHFAEETTDPHVVHVAVVPSSTGISVGGTLQTHHPLTLSASVGPLNPIASPPAPTGTVTFRDGATTLGTVDLATTNQWVISSPAVGAHSYTAEYSGDGYYLGSTSDPTAVTIVADTVDATGLGVQYTTFYPVTDGYRDTDAIRGTRLEPLSVSIKVYNSSNSLVRSAAYARATGAYSYAWNGRNSSGTVLAAGTYRIVQTLTDAFGTKKAWTFYVYLSTKKLVTHSTYVTKYAYPPTAFTAAGTGAGYYNSTSKYVKLVAGYDGVVLAGWQFALPSATVYKSLKFQVYAKSPATVFNAIAGQNFSVCGLTTTWYVDCFDHWHGIGGSSTAWFSTSLSPTYDRIGRTVRGLIDVEYGTVYVYKVRVYVAYATLQ